MPSDKFKRFLSSESRMSLREAKRICENAGFKVSESDGGANIVQRDYDNAIEGLKRAYHEAKAEDNIHSLQEFVRGIRDCLDNMSRATENGNPADLQEMSKIFGKISQELNSVLNKYDDFFGSYGG